MKRLMITGYKIYPLYLGGTEISIYEIARRVKKRFNLGIFLCDLDVKEIQNQSLKDFNIFPVKKSKNKLINYLLKIFCCWKSLVDFNPDIILSFSISEISIWSLIYAVLFRKKIIVRSEGSDLSYLNELNTFKKWSKILLCKKADQVLCLSSQHKKIISHFKLENKALVLRNGNRFQRSFNYPEKNFHKDKYNLLFVGRLTPIKNLKTLILGFRKLLDMEVLSKSEISLTITGDGPMMTDLKILSNELDLRKNILFHGNVKRNRLITLYKNTDIFILPSISEGNPLVINEALGFGCPIICSRIPSLQFLIEKENSLFFNPQDPKSLAETIHKLLLNKDLIKKMSKMNWNLSKNYTWEKKTKILCSILIKMLE